MDLYSSGLNRLLGVETMAKTWKYMLAHNEETRCAYCGSWCYVGDEVTVEGSFDDYSASLFCSDSCHAKEQRSYKDRVKRFSKATN